MTYIAANSESDAYEATGIIPLLIGAAIIGVGGGYAVTKGTIMSVDRKNASKAILAESARISDLRTTFDDLWLAKGITDAAIPTKFAVEMLRSLRDKVINPWRARQKSMAKQFVRLEPRIYQVGKSALDFYWPLICEPVLRKAEKALRDGKPTFSVNLATISTPNGGSRPGITVNTPSRLRWAISRTMIDVGDDLQWLATDLGDGSSVTTALADGFADFLQVVQQVVQRVAQPVADIIGKAADITLDVTDKVRDALRKAMYATIIGGGAYLLLSTRKRDDRRR